MSKKYYQSKILNNVCLEHYVGVNWCYVPSIAVIQMEYYKLCKRLLCLHTE